MHCRTCRHFRPYGKNDANHGECHRRSPVITRSNSAWPSTVATESCGDHEKRPPIEADITHYLQAAVDVASELPDSGKAMVIAEALNAVTKKD